MQLNRALMLIVSTMVVICGCGNPANKHTRMEGAAIALIPTSGVGLSAMFTVNLSPPDIFRIIGILYNDGLDGGNACYIFYNPAGNSFSLVKDSGSGADPLIPGQPVVENSQCALADNTRAELKNNELTLRLAITFKPQFAGPRNIYTYVEYKDGRKPIFQLKGTWIVGHRQKEEAITLIPSSGEGQSAIFTLDLIPADTMGIIGVLYNAEKDGGRACYVFYNPGSNSFSLVKDSGSGADPLMKGESLVENSQCALSGNGETQAEIRNNVLNLRLAITFKPKFAGPRNVYVYVDYKDGRKSVFQQEGTWLVTP